MARPEHGLRIEGRKNNTRGKRIESLLAWAPTHERRLLNATNLTSRATLASGIALPDLIRGNASRAYGLLPLVLSTVHMDTYIT
ncbi:hypothetical protein ARTHRO9AX_190153 [Arthrobacter sp. 9AX]|nr:hypothetical protein ARTHRO9AX_190153 [Arthrobacter sp. 9AX]